MMEPESIPIEVRRFLTEHISSVAQLDLLLLLRTDPNRAWTTDLLVAELRVEAAWLKGQLQSLCDRGLLECDDKGADIEYRYRPTTPELDQAVTGLARAYLLHRVSVIELIYSSPRTQTIRAFSDAFRLRKDPRNG